MADSNTAFELASTLQSAHLNQHPDPVYDSNPSTSFSHRIPVQFRPHVPLHRLSSSSSSLDASDSIPLSILEPPPRNPALPPLPDLRFEQSYLARIAPFSHPADGSPPQYGMIAWITFMDHVLLPLSQGLGWNLVVHGWRAWHSAARFSGAGVGARVRRWWWGVNGWRVPDVVQKGALDVDTGSVLKSERLAKEASEYFEFENGSAGMD